MTCTALTFYRNCISTSFSVISDLPPCCNAKYRKVIDREYRPRFCMKVHLKKVSVFISKLKVTEFSETQRVVNMGEIEANFHIIIDFQ
jgi:hypothetical protein